MPRPKPIKEPPLQRWFVGIDKTGKHLGKTYPTLVDAIADLRDHPAMTHILRMPDKVAMTSRKPLSSAEVESLSRWLRGGE